MRNIIEIDGQKAVVSFDPGTRLLRGEFLHLNGGAEFYANSVQELYEEGRTSLKVFLETCKENGIQPFRAYSGKFNLRLPPQVHEAAVAIATAEQKSLNEWVVEKIEHAVQEDA